MSNLDGIVCTPEELARSLDPATQGSIHCLTRDQSIGLTVVAETGLISMISVLFVFWIIFRNVFWRLRNLPKATRWHIFQEPMDVLMSSLFFADLIQALGAVMDLKWIVDGHVEIGAFCSAQGVIQQLGETGVAITTLAIAVYTFIGVWWGIGIGAVFVSKLVVGALWLFIVLMVVVGNATHIDRTKLYESPTPYWCWIGQDYLQFRIWGEYFWFWITLGVSLVAYVLLFFWSRGTIERDENSWWRFTVNHSGSVEGGKRSFTMLFYPIIYSILILPLSVVRWIGFVQERGGKQNHIASAATLTVIAIYGLSGFCNVILLVSTRPSSVLFGRRAMYDTGRAPSHVHVQGATDTTHVEAALEEPKRDVGRLPSR